MDQKDTAGIINRTIFLQYKAEKNDKTQHTYMSKCIIILCIHSLGISEKALL
jgi:hypothetical protein